MTKWQEDFKNPPASYRIKPFWFWNGEMTKAEIENQIKEMADKGLGGMFICARQGMTAPYLSGEWFELVDYACEMSEKYGLEAWLYDEYPYPSGMSGGEVLLEHPEAEHMVLHHKRLTSHGGVIEADLGWSRILYARAIPLTEAGKPQWGKAIDLKREIGNLQTEKIYQQTGLTRYNNKRFFSYGPRKLLKTELPEGEWRIEIYSEAAMGDFKYYGGFFDPCNQEAVETFLETTHERYKEAIGERFGAGVYGMFSDEVGLLSPIPWSKLLPGEFERRNGYSLLDNLPALHDATIEGALKLRYDLYETAHELFRSSYHETVAGWCKENHLKYATEVPSMRLGTQKFSDVIGGDTAHEKLGKPLEWIYDEYLKNYRSNSRSVSSLARQLGKKDAMIESFHSVGWTMTLQDAKWMIDRLGADGINLYNFHAFYYTIQDITKHDAPPSQFLQNPYWKHYRKLADYVGRMGVMVSNTEADIRVAVLDPVVSLWTKLGNPFHGFPYKGESEEEKKRCDRLREDWVHICKSLLFEQIGYEHLDAEIFRDAEIDGGKIKIGRAVYQVLVVPPAACAEYWVLEKLKEFAAQGGTVIAMGLLPYEVIDRDENPEKGYCEFFGVEKCGKEEYWCGETDGKHVKNIDVSALACHIGKGNVYFLPAKGGLKNASLEKVMAGLCREAGCGSGLRVCEGKGNQVITSVRIDGDGSRFVFAANQGAGDVTVQIDAEKVYAENISGIDTLKAWSLERFSLEDGNTERIGTEEDGMFEVHLGSFESCWLHLVRVSDFASIKNHTGTENVSRIVVSMEEPADVSIDGVNFLRFSNLSMSLDRAVWKETETKTFIEQCSETKLLNGSECRFEGMFGTPKRITPAYPLSCWYRVEFEAETEGITSDLSLFMDRETIAGEYEIFINGEKITKEDFIPIRINDQNNCRCDISGMVKEGVNEILVRVLVTKDEEGIRDPFYISGSFGVRGNTLTAKPKKAVLRHSWCEGFPYYSGTITYEKEFNAGGENGAFELELKTDRPIYDVVKVLVNGQSLGVKAYTPYVWKGKAGLLRGEGNHITVRVTNTLANMLDGTYFDYDSHSLISIDSAKNR